MTKPKTHYALETKNHLFVPVCRNLWNIDCGMETSEHTDDWKEVTCKKCLKKVASWGYEQQLKEIRNENVIAELKL